MPKATQPEGEQATPARPPVVTPTDEWLARLSDQLDQLLAQGKPADDAAVATPADTPRARGRKRTEVRGQ